MIKKDFVQIIKNIKKTKKEFALGMFNNYTYNGIFHDFVLYNEEENMIAYSKKTSEEIKLTSIVGADDIEYINEAIKDADKDDELFIVFDGEDIAVASMERTFYRAKAKETSNSIKLVNPKKHTEINSALLKDSFKLIENSIDKKGFNDIPYFYISSHDKLIAYSFSAWSYAKFIINEEFNKENKKTFKYNPSDISSALSLLPGGKTSFVDISLSGEGKLLFSFQNCDIVVSGQKTNNHDFLNHLDLEKPTGMLKLDSLKLKTMINMMKGVFLDKDGDFLKISLENEQFALIENIPFKENREQYSLKVPVLEINGNTNFSIYGKYIKDFTSKVSTEGVVIESDGSVIKISSEDRLLTLLSMEKRKEDIVEVK